jgi:hypothetical protein
MAFPTVGWAGEEEPATLAGDECGDNCSPHAIAQHAFPHCQPSPRILEIAGMAWPYWVSRASPDFQLKKDAFKTARLVQQRCFP